MTSKVTVAIEDFQLDKLAAPGRYSVALLILGSEGLQLPLLVVRGDRPGNTLLVSAAVHGDEYEGVRVILDSFKTSRLPKFRAIPAPSTESPGGRRISEEALRGYSLGLENLLRFLGIVSRSPEHVECEVHL